MYNPVSTYRLQFHKDFTFDRLGKIIPYLQELGIVTIYASPILQAAPGSTHGYNGTSPDTINREIGTEDELKSISKTLHEYSMGWIQDIAPNHMAYHKENEWLVDVLLNGKDSPYADFFDIVWDSPLYDGRIMVPFEGSELESLLREKDPAETHYKICHWQETERQINYRRFFTVNDLICLNIHYQNVFEAYHRYVKLLQEEGIFQGFRIDHIDGLYDPSAYLENIRQLAGDDCFIVVEKILGRGEKLPVNWPVQGNTGYDFLSLVNNLFTNNANADAFREFYERLIEDKRSVEDQITEKKANILYHHMQGELENLYRLLKNSLLDDEPEDAHLKEAIGELLIHCPVYRFYGNSMPLQKEERAAVSSIFQAITKSKEYLKPAVSLLQRILFNKTENGDEAYNRKALHFYRRCMQFSGPLMAKGVEDTLMYTYNSFIGHNEVGDAPDSFGTSVQGFHDAMQERLKIAPFSMNATATHDTKRGEDVRARLNVLTDLKEEWFQAVESWYQLNANLPAQGAPDRNDEYLIYQSLIGHYPMPQQETGDFEERFHQFLTKALREAKRKSNWSEPDEAYEKATRDFVSSLLNKKKPFWKSFTA
ncbi:MAG: malto-oligosyltrehalose synthase, partial [Chitinophagaceae bacterium]|nr:malto-oligosyltrehalose synthase [Chitinophagaceae bacterium]